MAEETNIPVIEVFGGEPRLAGCLPRKSKVGELCPLFSGVVEDMTDAELANAVGKVTLRHFASIYDQDGKGSCAAEASDQAGSIARVVAGEPLILFNPWFMYRVTGGGRDAGSNIEDNLVFCRDQGMCPVSVWPRSKGLSRPSEEAIEEAKKYRILEFYDLTTVRQMRTALAKGFPVVWGANGHALCKVEDQGPDKGLDANSWGTGWGDNGFGVWTSYRGIQWGYGAFAVRVATSSSGEPVPKLDKGIMR